MGNIQKTVIDSIRKDDPTFNADGYISLAIVYAVFAITNWAAPSIIIITGPRVAMLIGAVTYMLFIMSFLLPRVWLLYLASAVIGVGAAIIWTAQGNYLTLNSNSSNISRNSGIFWAMLQCSMFFGNLFVYIQFQGKEEITEDMRVIVFWVLIAVSIVGLLFLLILRPAVNTSSEDIVVTKPLDALRNAGNLFVTRDMLLLCITFFYTGIELSFYSGVYSNAIGFTQNLGAEAKQLIGMSGIFIGVGEVVGGSLFGILGSKTIRWGRSPIVVGGFVIHIVAFFLIFLNLPNESPIGETSQDAYITTNGILAIFCSFLLGFGDSCYNTQIYSTLGGVFASDSASAFAIFKFTQSVAAAICFFYATSVGLYIQLGILVVLATLGTITFCLVEYFAKNTEKPIPETFDTDSNS
ncbi:uncharacterized protein CBL_09520 [Carabus blaptoides fortunei]